MTRFERKFFVPNLSIPTVESLVKCHPAFFSEIYPPRGVNNLYFDSIDLTNYNDNIEGLARRQKVRIRWYGNLFGNIEEPVLQLKVKNGLLGEKQSYPLLAFAMNHQFNEAQIWDAIEHSQISDTLKQLLKSCRPILLNHYKRKYFQSADKHYRLTIDAQLQFYRINYNNRAFQPQIRNQYGTIVEIKYDQEWDHEIDKITHFFPFRVTKSSKYVQGIKSDK